MSGVKDDLLEYARQRRERTNQDEGSWFSGASDYIFGKPRGLSSLVTGEDDSIPSLRQRFDKIYGDTVGMDIWPKGMRKSIEEDEADLSKRFGPTAGKVLMAGPKFADKAGSYLLGSPIDIASTAATYATAGTGPLAARFLAKAPKIYKGVANAARVMDAVQGARAGSFGIEGIEEGDAWKAALGTGGAALGAYSASTSPYLTKPKPVAELPPETPSFLRSDPKFAARPVTRGVVEPDVALPGKTVTIDGSAPGKPKKFKETLVTPKPKTAEEAAAVEKMVRESQEPLRFSRPVTGPEVITDPARLLPEKSGLPAAPPSEVRASVTHPRDVWANRPSGRTVGTGGDAERAIADLTAAGEEVNARNLERYLQIDEYRRGIQNRADAVGKPGGYEATVSSEQVTPATAAPNYPPEIAPETRAAVDAAGERVNAGQTTPDTLASRPTERGITIYKRSRIPITEFTPEGARQTRTGIFAGTTHFADSDDYIDSFGEHLTTRELPKDAKIFDVADGITKEQQDELWNYLNSRGLLNESRAEFASRFHPDANVTREVSDLLAMRKGGRDYVKETMPRRRELNDKKLSNTATPEELAELTGIQDNAAAITSQGSADFLNDSGYDAIKYRGVSAPGLAHPGQEAIGYAVRDASTLRSLDDGGSVAQAVDEPVAQTVGDGEITSRIDARTEAPYRYGENPKLDGQMKSKVQRVLKTADKELAKVTEPGERRTRLIEILGRELTLNELGAAFEGKILNSGIVRDASTARIGLGLEESANVPRVPEQDITPNIGPPNNTPPPGFGGRRGLLETAPPTGTEGIVSGPPTTPPQVSGLRQVLAEPGLASRPVMRTPEDVLEALRSRGVTEPTPEMVQKIMSDPGLLDKIVPGTSEFVPDVSRGFTPTNRPVEARSDRLIPERVPVVDNKWQSPEAITAVLEKARAAKPRDVFGNNDWERAQEVARQLGHPDVADAIGAANRYVRTQQMGEAERGAKGLGMSMETELGRLGKAGEEIVNLKRQANTDAVSRFDDYIKDVIDDVDALPQDRFEKVVDFLEGNKTVKLSPEETSIAERMRKAFQRSGQDMNDRGLLEKGVVQDYWPRRYDGVPDKTIADAMREQGVPADKIAERIDFIRKQRELKTAGEYSREGNNIPGYRKDKDVFVDHMKAVSNRIELADRFGVKDTADPNSPISVLLGQTSDPTRARDLMERILRGGPQDGFERTSQLVRTYSTGAMMQLSGVANLFGGALPVAVRGNLAEAGKSLFKIFNGASPEMQFMKNVNRFNEFKSGFQEGMTTNKFNKWYGIDWTQNQVNKLAGSTGLGTAKSLFQELKANPTNSNVAWMLKDLVLEDPKVLLKQGALTDKQLKRAATRMVDITQGVVHNEKLPYLWVRSGLGTVPQIFQRIAFQTTKAMKDGIQQAPVSSIAKLGTFGLALGEGIAAIKEVPKTAGQVGINTAQQALGITKEDKDFVPTFKENMGYGKSGTDASRFYNTKRWLTALNKEAGDNDTLVHSINALENSFAGGMPLTLLSAFAGALSKDSKDPGGDAMSNLFVAIDEGGNLLKQGVDTATQIVKPAFGGTPDFRDTARFVTRRLPIPGGVQSGVIREIDSSKQANRPVRNKRSLFVKF